MFLNLDVAPLGTPEPSPAAPDASPPEAESEPESQVESGVEPAAETERNPSPDKPSTTTVNVGTRTIVTRTVATNTAKPVQRVVRSPSALPASAPVTVARVRRIPAIPPISVHDAEPAVPAPAPDAPQAIEKPVPDDAAPRPVVPATAAPLIALLGGAGPARRRPEPPPPPTKSPTDQPAEQPPSPSPSVVEPPAPTSPVSESPTARPPSPAPDTPAPTSPTLTPPVPQRSAPQSRTPTPPPAKLPALRPSSRYSTDPAAAARYALSVAERVMASSAPVPYFAEDATDGLAVPERGGLSFAVTIPFALDATLPAEAHAALREAIFAQLARQRLIRHPDEAGGSDFWLLESDQAGGLLLISPLLRDTQLTWAAVRGVLEIVVRHRGVSGRPGTVRVEPGRAPEPPIDRRTAVSRLFGRNSDVLRRLGVGLREPDGLVFEFLDGSFDPGVVQARVKLALAMTSAAMRAGAADTDFEPQPPGDVVHRVCVPDGRMVPGALTIYELDQRSGTVAVTDLLAGLFRRDADIEQSLALAALTPWPSARTVLTDEGVSRAAHLLASGLSQGFEGGCGFLPACVPRALCEQHALVRRASEHFTGRLFKVLLGVSGEGSATVFDGLEVTAPQFATLLRGTGWQPEAGLLLGFVRLDAAVAPNPRATWRDPLPPPLSEDWPALLDWTRRVAAELGTGVYTAVPANATLRHVPAEVLGAYQAYATAETARLTGDWRIEALTSSAFLHHLPPDALPADTDARPGPALVRLPEEPDESLSTLISTLREAIASLPRAAPHAPAIEGPIPVTAGGSELVHPGFLEHPSLFDAVAELVAGRLRRGEPPLSYEISRAAVGASLFVLEWEFVLEVAERDAALARLSVELDALRPGPWRLRPSGAASDRVLTLTGPPLGDDVVSWYNLERALKAMRRHGGTSAPGGTERLRIEPADFVGSVGRYQALMVLVRAHRDVLHRIAADPAGIVPTPAWRDPALGEPGVITVPPWSGALDAAALQTRTRLWLGLVDAARRLVGLEGEPGGPGLPAARPDAHEAVQPLRYPANRPLITGRIAVYEPGSPADTLAARSLIDTALTGRADRERAAALYHVTPWPGARGGRVRVRRGAGWASFGQPGHVRPARRQRDAELFGRGTFLADLDLGSRRPAPVVYDDVGPAAVRPVHFAALLREAGRPDGAPVALRIGLGGWRDWSETTAWLRELARFSEAGSFLGVEGARAVELPDAALDGVTVYALADEARPGLDWAVTPPPEVWLGIGAPPAARLAALPDRRLRGFVRDASWHGVGSSVLFAAPAELGRHVRRAEGLEQHSLLITTVFARSRGGVPQVVVDGVERDLEPAELAAVLFRHAGAAPGAELRLVVLDAIAPDDGVGRLWVAAAAAAAGRIVHYPAPRTGVRLDERRRGRTAGGKPADYRLTAPAGTDPAAPRWVAVTAGTTPTHSAFTEEEGRLRPADAPPRDTTQEERWPVRHP